MAPLLLDVGQILGRTGVRRPVRLRVRFDDLGLSSSAVPADVDVELDGEVEAVPGGVTVTGQVRADWVASCRRCLEPVRGRLEAAVREVFSTRPTDEDLRPIDDDTIDLEPVVREAVLLDLPLSPLCSPECRGPSPSRFPTDAVDRRAAERAAGDERDPRWAALDELRFDEDERD